LFFIFEFNFPVILGFEVSCRSFLRRGQNWARPKKHTVEQTLVFHGSQALREHDVKSMGCNPTLSARISMNDAPAFATPVIWMSREKPFKPV
jgi:hypothetical protein